MKHSILIIGTALLSISVYAAKQKFNCTVTGKITNADGKIIMIKNLTGRKTDTLLVTNNQFTYKSVLIEPTPFLVSNEANSTYQVFFAEPNSNITIEYDQKDSRIVKVEGSKNQPIFESLLQKQSVLQKEAGRVQQIYATTDNKDSLNNVMKSINETLKANFFDYLKVNGETEVAAFVIYSSITQAQNIPLSVADSMVNNLHGKVLESYYGKENTKLISRMRAVEVGTYAPNFTLSDSTEKKMYSLSTFKGKYLLVDFWASWCGPCKQEIPYLKKAYEKYKSKGFEIMSVSLDDKRSNWIAALKQFEMPWAQISDVKGFKSVVNELYHIPSIPKTLLLDKEGKIIATDLRGDDLDKKLEELLP
jgi:thiol-disulfide isomerase/thioredoxin